MGADSGEVVHVDELARIKLQEARQRIKTVAAGDWFNDPTKIVKDGKRRFIYYSVRRYVLADEVRAGKYVLARGEFILDGIVRTKSGREKRLSRGRNYAWNEEVKQ